jgi:diacylglycerol O-acyltransferase
VFPVVPIMGNMTLGIGALSYAGQFNITPVADRETCPDVGVFVEGARTSLDALARSMVVRSA